MRLDFDSAKPKQPWLPIFVVYWGYVGILSTNNGESNGKINGN